MALAISRGESLAAFGASGCAGSTIALAVEAGAGSTIARADGSTGWGLAAGAAGAGAGAGLSAGVGAGLEPAAVTAGASAGFAVVFASPADGTLGDEAAAA